MTEKKTPEQKAAAKAARQAHVAERKAKAAAKAEADAAAARFNPRSTRRSVADSLADDALSDAQYRIASRRGLVGPVPTPDPIELDDGVDLGTINRRPSPLPAVSYDALIAKARQHGWSGEAPAEPAPDDWPEPCPPHEQARPPRPPRPARPPVDRSRPHVNYDEFDSADALDDEDDYLADLERRAEMNDELDARRTWGVRPVRRGDDLDDD